MNQFAQFIESLSPSSKVVNLPIEIEDVTLNDGQIYIGTANTIYEMVAERRDIFEWHFRDDIQIRNDRKVIEIDLSSYCQITDTLKEVYHYVDFDVFVEEEYLTDDMIEEYALAHKDFWGKA